MTQDAKKLVENYHDMIYAFIFKHGGKEDDYFSLTETAMRSAESYDKRKGAKFSTYLWQSLLNGFIDEKRKAYLKMKNEQLALADGVDFNRYVEPQDVEEIVVSKLFVEWFKENELTKRQKLILQLKMFGFTNRAIAYKVGISERAVTDQLRKIRNKYLEVNERCLN